MGIEGAALATGLGQVVTLVLYLAFYFTRPLPVKIHKSCHVDRAMAGRLYAVGIPATLNMALPSLLITALNGILSAYSQVYVVVLGIYYKLQTFLYLPANGIIQGMRPLIGYNYGAGETKRVHRLFADTLYLSLGIMLFGTVFCQLFPDSLIALFSSNPETIHAGGMALRIISLGFLVSSVSITSSGALEGLGKGIPSLLISLCRYTIIIIPAAFILSRIFGASGIWYAFGITEFATAVIAYMTYRRATIKN